jgi:hypothetical protein
MIKIPKIMVLKKIMARMMVIRTCQILPASNIPLPALLSNQVKPVRTKNPFMNLMRFLKLRKEGQK